jgi:hypothetical protein
MADDFAGAAVFEAGAAFLAGVLPSAVGFTVGAADFAAGPLLPTPIAFFAAAAFSGFAFSFATAGLLVAFATNSSLVAWMQA